MFATLNKQFCKNRALFSFFKPCYNFSSSSNASSTTDKITPAEPFETLRKNEFSSLYSPGYEKRISGHATKQGTERYSKRKENVPQSNFRKPYRDDLTISTVGIGTYVGAPDEIDDLKMFNAIIESVESGGINLIDTAINYRYQKSERVIGAALKYLLNKGYSRDELFICSKNGYIPEDADRGVSGQILINSLVEQGKIKEEDVVGTVHCMNPNFLENQLETTLSNLGLETLDLYYIHNPAESQLPLVGYEKYMERLTDTFKFCEEKVKQGKIGAYGLATWICFRAKVEEENIYLRLQEVVDIAKKVAGENHNFKYVQLPVNLIMPEAFAQPWQEFKEGNKTLNENLFQVARRSRVNVITSSALAQGELARFEPPVDFLKLSSIPAKHIQFTRSIPAQALLSTLVGQKSRQHVLSNLEVVRNPPLSMEEWLQFVKPPEDEQKTQ